MRFCQITISKFSNSIKWNFFYSEKVNRNHDFPKSIFNGLDIICYRDPGNKLQPIPFRKFK